MDELQSRYALDLAQSFALSARYVSDSKGPWGINYSIGPGVLCASESSGLVNKLSKAINSSLGKSPLGRELRGSVLDLMADDLYLSLGLHRGEIHYSPSNSILTGCLHRILDAKLKEYFKFLFGGAFDYRIEAIWRPFEGTELDSFVYSNVSYGSELVPLDSQVYVSSFQLAVPADEAALTNLHETLSGFLHHYAEIERVLSTPEAARFEEFEGIAVENASGFSINKRASIVFKMWPKKEA